MCIRFAVSFLFLAVCVAAPNGLSAQTSSTSPGYTSTIPQYGTPQPDANPQYQQPQQYPQQQQHLNASGTTQPYSNSNHPQVVPARPVGTVPGANATPNPPHQQPVQNTAPAAPFQLTPLEQQQLETFLTNWERKCQTINVMECEFQKFFYDGMSVSADGTASPTYVTYGIAKYSKPDKGYYWEQGEIHKDGLAPGGPRENKMICDGRAYYYFDYQVKEIVEFPLPEQMKGSRNLDSPIMFIVGANPGELKERFFLRLLPHSNPEYIVLEAFPKSMDDAKSFRAVQMIVYAKSYDPYGMRQFNNGSSNTTYIITGSTINPKVGIGRRLDFLGFGAKDEFDNVLRSVPSDWTHRIDNELVQQATANPQPGNMGMR